MNLQFSFSSQLQRSKQHCGERKKARGSTLMNYELLLLWIRWCIMNKLPHTRLSCGLPHLHLCPIYFRAPPSLYNRFIFCSDVIFKRLVVLWLCPRPETWVQRCKLRAETAPKCPGKLSQKLQWAHQDVWLPLKHFFLKYLKNLPLKKKPCTYILGFVAIQQNGTVRSLQCFNRRVRELRWELEENYKQAIT